MPHIKPLLAVKAAEVRWASSALFSCAVQLQSIAQITSAEPLLIAASNSAAFSLVDAVQHGAETRVISSAWLHLA